MDFNVNSDFQLNLLWKKRGTEIIVATLPSQVKGRSLFIHHTDLRCLRPHLWLTGEVGVLKALPLTASLSVFQFVVLQTDVFGGLKTSTNSHTQTHGHTKTHTYNMSMA